MMIPGGAETLDSLRPQGLVPDGAEKLANPRLGGLPDFASLQDRILGPRGSVALLEGDLPVGPNRGRNRRKERCRDVCNHAVAHERGTLHHVSLSDRHIGCLILLIQLLQLSVGRLDDLAGRSDR